MKVKIYHCRDTEDPGGSKGINSVVLFSLPSAARLGFTDLPPLSTPASTRIVSGKQIGHICIRPERNKCAGEAARSFLRGDTSK